MFRMLQLLERESSEDVNQFYDASPAAGRMATFTENEDHRSSKHKNLHKYLLYRPTFNQLYVFLASGFKELPPNGVLLLYLSADGYFPNAKYSENCKTQFITLFDTQATSLNVHSYPFSLNSRLRFWWSGHSYETGRRVFSKKKSSDPRSSLLISV